MSDTCATLKIKAGDDYAIINESDFDPAIHEMMDGESLPQNPADGSDGDGDASGVNDPDHTDGVPTPIPADWREMHHIKIIALAKELAGDFEATADKTMTERARSIIEDAEADRANPATA